MESVLHCCLEKVASLRPAICTAPLRDAAAHLTSPEAASPFRCVSTSAIHLHKYIFIHTINQENLEFCET